MEQNKIIEKYKIKFVIAYMIVDKQIKEASNNVGDFCASINGDPEYSIKVKKHLVELEAKRKDIMNHLELFKHNNIKKELDRLTNEDHVMESKCGACGTRRKYVRNT